MYVFLVFECNILPSITSLNITRLHCVLCILLGFCLFFKKLSCVSWSLLIHPKHNNGPAGNCSHLRKDRARTRRTVAAFTNIA